MKTKEIDVWVCGDRANYKPFWRSSTVEIFENKLSDNGFYFKAKLIIELPEQKIEITESELISAYKKSMDGHENYPLLSKILKELGFKE